MELYFFILCHAFKGSILAISKKKKKLKIGCIFLTSSSFTLTNYVFFLDFIEMSSLVFRYFTSTVPSWTKKKKKNPLV